VVNGVTLGQVSFECFCFPCQSFHRLLHTHHPSCWYNRPVVADVPSVTQLKEKKNNCIHTHLKGAVCELQCGLWTVLHVTTFF
jgi:hypothetical protein